VNDTMQLSLLGPQAPQHAASITHVRLMLFNTQHASPGRAYRSGGPGESHPRAPTERSVTVSRHSALLIESVRTRGSKPSA
jgi:hypothetical protein